MKNQERINFWQANYFAPLDGLRAVAVLLVIAGHTRTTLPIQRYFSGGLGVGIFFVLSGFLITILLLREESASGGVSLGSFYIRRALRILPPYFLALSVYLLIGLIPSQYELKIKVFNGLPYFLSLRNEYVPSGLAVAFTHSWSLSVEEKFYFVWPLILSMLLRKPAWRWAVVPITLAPLFISCNESLPIAYFSLLAGCCIAIALHALRNKQQAVLTVIDRVPATLLYVLWLLAYFASLRSDFRVSFIVVTAAVLPMLLLKQTRLCTLLGSRVCAWVGKRTYSLYLFHALCLTAIEQRLLHPTTVAIYLAVVALAYLASLGVAAVVYTFLEKPAMSLGRRLAAAYIRSQRTSTIETALVQISPTPVTDISS